jgi:uncharacterized membrane protein
MQQQPADVTGSDQAKDPLDSLIDDVLRFVPKHIWVVIIAVLMMLSLGRILVKTAVTVPARPDAQDVAGETLEGRVVELLSVPQGETDSTASTGAPVQRVLVEITRGAKAGKRVEVDYGDHMVIADSARLQMGDRVLVEYSTDGPQGDRYAISDFVRLPALLLLALAFSIATVAVGHWVGLRALVSIGLSVLALATLIVPGIIAGHDPVFVAFTGCFLLMAASLYLTYQWKWKTHVAVISVTIGLVLACVLATAVGGLSRLTGLGTEDAAMLLESLGPHLSVRGLLLAGILIGAVGVLGDVTVSQASATFELKQANPSLGWRELFRHTMIIGRDHIASMVNTLLLAYVGASLPLFLLLTTQNLSLTQTLNREFIAEEIVRTLVGSLGIIMAVPTTSLIAALIAQRHVTGEVPDTD